MIAHSVPLMTAIDLFVLGVAVYVVVLYLRHRRGARRPGLSIGLGALLLGVDFAQGHLLGRPELVELAPR